MAATTNNYGLGAGEPVQLRALKQNNGSSPAVSGNVHGMQGTALTITVDDPIAAGTVVGIEAGGALLLAEAGDSCRWGTGVQVTFKVSQIIPFHTDLHNLMVAVNGSGVHQARRTPSQMRRA